ncbi:MAG: peptide-N4-asparagine amidase [Acidobacteriaceae bacterium]
MPNFPFRLAAAVLFTSLASSLGGAQNYTAPSIPVIGSANTVTADPVVPKPSGPSCTVTLFTNYEFADFNPKYFSYTPACPGPWKKVVFEGDFNITAGRQFDRTAEIWIGGANIYFGTTAEPSATVARNWHVESALTDYSTLFNSAQNGRVDLGNLVNQTYTGIIYGSAKLVFYPVDDDAPRVADQVLPLSAGPTGGTVTLNTPTDMLSATFTLPLNVEKAYLDVFAQSQGGDEFWYTCVPNDVASELQSCGGTAFRETEVTIDGTPAGVAPIYPWIYTGGIDPYLWRPIVGVHTLNFAPYRVDLTPFAGVLSNGQPHTVSLSVFNANGYFSATATLLVYQDHGSGQVTGAVTRNTIQPANPVIRENISNKNGDIRGTVKTDSNRSYQVAGYVNTSHGRVDTKVEQSIDFDNHQKFKINSSVYVQDISQSTDTASTVSTTEDGKTTTQRVLRQYPLVADISLAFNPDGSFSQTTHIVQGLERSLVDKFNERVTYASNLLDYVSPSDTLLFDAQGNLTGNQGQRSEQIYRRSDSNGKCYYEKIKAKGGVLTSVKTGCN